MAVRLGCKTGRSFFRLSGCERPLADVQNLRVTHLGPSKSISVKLRTRTSPEDRQSNMNSKSHVISLFLLLSCVQQPSSSLPVARNRPDADMPHVVAGHLPSICLLFLQSILVWLCDPQTGFPGRRHILPHTTDSRPCRFDLHDGGAQRIKGIFDPACSR